MRFRYAFVFISFMYSLNNHASDMAIVDAVTGNAQSTTSTSSQPKITSGVINSNRASDLTFSKFEYTARQKARDMGCETQKNPIVEPQSMGIQVLIFQCQDGRDLRLQCASGLGCKPI
jgi:hypothetical protein